MRQSNATAAINRPCGGTLQAGDACANCPDVFTVSGSLLANLVQGDNVVAVEVHNYGTLADIVFGSALIPNSPAVTSPRLYLIREEDWATLYWNGEGFTLQHSSDLSSFSAWSDVPGPVTQSPFTVTNADTRFYRLRN